MTTKKESYTKAIAEIEEIISDIENKQPDMDELSSKVARALKLIKFCKTKLRSTEENINKLLEDMGN